MMKTTKLFIVALACAATSGLFGQSAAPVMAPNAASAQEPKILTNQDVGQQLLADLGERNSQLGNQPVKWYDTGNGYYGTYSIGDQIFMTMYNKDGTYQQTLMRGEWNGPDLPPSLKSSFDKSLYKSQTVTACWIVSDPNVKEYYLEIQNKQGKTSRIWVDDNGKISKAPPRYSSKNTTPK